MTSDRYGHLFGDEFDAVAARLDAAPIGVAADGPRTAGPGPD
jgi:hypothetical protein